MAVEVIMPKMSDHMEEGKLIRWLVAEGTHVASRQPIVEVETDKAVGEVESPADGILAGIQARDDSVVRVGAVVAFIVQPGEAVPQMHVVASPTNATALSQTAAPAESALAVETGEGVILAAPAARRVAAELGVNLALVKGTGPRGRVKEEDVRAFAEQQKRAARPLQRPRDTHVLASPVARKMAEERGIDLVEIAGTGPGGRITHEDVLAYASADSGAASPESAETTAVSEFEWVELTTIRRITGERMAASKQTVPHFTLTMEVDMAKAALLREVVADRTMAESGARLSYTALMVKAVAAALKKNPLANAEFVGGRIKVYKRIHVGVAVGVEGGLVVPVIHDADTKSLSELNRIVKDFQEKSATLRFTPAELAGGTFTITNLGMFGVDQFTAIINAPQSAILAVGRIANKPVALDGERVAVRPMMAMSLSVDHRVLDGVSGAGFLTDLKKLIEDPYGLV